MTNRITVFGTQLQRPRAMTPPPVPGSGPSPLLATGVVLTLVAAALLVYRSAWTKDTRETRGTREVAIAKLHATEMAQRAIDQAVQIFGGQGVVIGNPVERLYREIRALRIYEGTSEIQKLIIAGQVLTEAGG